jgi:hypothetical protein
MKGQNCSHLQEEQILWAVIDGQELAVAEQQHLRECPLCKRRVAQIQDELQEFGQKARQAVPPFSQPVTVPEKKTAVSSHNTGWLPFFAAAAMAGFVVFFYIMGMETLTPVQLTPLQSQDSVLDDETLMRQIAELVEDPLSEDMYEVSGEDGTDFDEEFLQFLVPDIQDDFLSELIMQGGINQC